jgi:hypothetical protein
MNISFIAPPPVSDEDLATFVAVGKKFGFSVVPEIITSLGLNTWISPKGELIYLMSIPKDGMNIEDMYASISQLPAVERKIFEPLTHNEAYLAHSQGLSIACEYWVTPFTVRDLNLYRCPPSQGGEDMPTHDDTHSTYTSFYKIILKLV